MDEIFGIKLTALEYKLNDKIITERLREEFAENGLILSQNAIVSIEENDRKWKITDDLNIYHLINEGSKLCIYRYYYPNESDDFFELWAVEYVDLSNPIKEIRKALYDMLVKLGNTHKTEYSGTKILEATYISAQKRQADADNILVYNICGDRGTRKSAFQYLFQNGLRFEVQQTLPPQVPSGKPIFPHYYRYSLADLDGEHSQCWPQYWYKGKTVFSTEELEKKIVFQSIPQGASAMKNAIGSAMKQLNPTGISESDKSSPFGLWVKINICSGKSMRFTKQMEKELFDVITSEFYENDENCVVGEVIIEEKAVISALEIGLELSKVKETIR